MNMEDIMPVIRIGCSGYINVSPLPLFWNYDFEGILGFGIVERKERFDENER
jgi:hypothetical protein